MKVLIAGATSSIAHETAKCFANEGAELFLVARNAAKLKAVADDLKVRGAGCVESFLLDMTELERHQEMFDAALAALGGLDMLLVAHGTLEDQFILQKSVEATLRSLDTNFTSVVSLLTIAANYFEERKKGCIAVITSVAGDRGRQYNYIYGTAKGGLNTFLQGLRNRLFKSGVAVVTIKPGPVDTPMTLTHKKNMLFATPQAVGKRIHDAMVKGKDVVYAPWFWRYIMFGIVNMPEFIFKRTNLKGG